MTRFTAALSILLVGAMIVAGDTQAQRRGMMARADSAQGPQMGMMQGGMMGPNMMAMMQGMQYQMVQNPMHRAHMTAFSLPILVDTLGVSDQQKDQMNTLKGTMLSRRQTHRQQMQVQHTELMALFEGGTVPATDIVREHLQTMADLRVRHQAEVYEAAQQMRGVLTDDQRQRLDNMTPQQYTAQIMTHMPVRDMMQMMQFARGGVMGNCPMQQSSRMGRGMGPRGNRGRMQTTPQNQ